MTAPSKIAVLANRNGIDNQDLLVDAAERWRTCGGKIVGLVAQQRDGADSGCTAGYLRDIATNRRFAIAHDEPPVGTTCHLDAEGMLGACLQLLPQIASSDAVILSKFGKMEVSRAGLWMAFSKAIAEGKPVLTTVSSKHVDVWTAFAPNARWLESDFGSLERWWQSISTECDRAPRSGNATRPSPHDG